MGFQKSLIIFTLGLIFLTGFSLAGNFKIQYPSGTDIFVVDTTGKVTANNITILNNGNLTTEGEIYIKGVAVSPYLYNQSLNVPANSVNIEYKNITNLPTCNAGEHLFYDGSSLPLLGQQQTILFTMIL